MPPPRDEPNAQNSSLDPQTFQHLSKSPPNGSTVYVLDDFGEQGFVRAKVVNSTGGGTQLLVSREGADRVHSVPLKLAFAYSPETADDISNLPHQHEPALLDNLRSRFGHGLIYTSAGSRVLISLNPKVPLPQEYGEIVMHDYRRGLVRGATRRPHLYAVGEAAFASVVRHGASASIIVSGESGAGKTEASKHLLRYLSWRGGTKPTSAADDDLGVAGRVLHSTPIFEAFGNAATSRNRNSSRFGKHMDLVLTPDGFVTGARVRTYLLERTRVATVPPHGERNFHIFYYLALAGKLPAGRDASQFRTLRVSGHAASGEIGSNAGVQANGTANTADHPDALRRESEIHALAELRVALTHLFVPLEAQEALWKLLGALMLLAEVDFESDGNGGATASGSTLNTLAAAEDALGCPGLDQLLISQTMKSPRGGSTYKIAVDARRAAAARDTICAELYRCVFEAVVARINAVLSGTRAEFHQPMSGGFGGVMSRQEPAVGTDNSREVNAPARLAGKAPRQRRAAAQRQKQKRSAPSDHLPSQAPPSPPLSPPSTPLQPKGPLGVNASALSIGLLDLFGFESFEHNSFEQLCINYANEALQHFFIQCIFHAEELLHLEEGVKWEPSWYPDNRDVLGEWRLTAQNETLPLP